jgi:enterochelin esterase-like enzyme
MAVSSIAASLPGMNAIRPGRRTRWLAVPLAALFLGSGAYGAWSYVHDYEVYRGFAPATDPHGVPRGTVRNVVFFSHALRQRRNYTVYTPPGYAAAAARGARFPVLYLLHAPPGRPENYFDVGGLSVRMDVLIKRRRIHPFLIVAPYGRTNAYGSDAEWANARAGRFESFVLDTVRSVDARFSTIRSRSERMIAGLSEGGYGAANIALRNLGTFGSFESWSGYYVQTPTGVFAGLPPSLLEANSPAFYINRRVPAIRRLGLRAFVYQGDRDDVSASAMWRFVSDLRAAGADVRAAVYPGKHNWALWRAHLGGMLVFAGRTFAAAAEGTGRAAHQRALPPGRPALGPSA